MTQEEGLVSIPLEERELDVAARIDVQGLLRRTDCVEQGKTRCLADQFVIPLEDEQNRDGECAGRLFEARGPGSRPKSRQPQNRCAEARFSRDERQADRGPIDTLQ